MKLNKYSWLAACAMVLASCQSDTLKEDLQQKGTIYTITGQMKGGNAMSRAQIQLNNPNSGQEIFFWNEGDQFDVHQYYREELVSGDPEERYSTVFTISDDYSATGSEDKTSAVFNTTKPAFSTIDYVAVYPAGIEIDYYSKELTFQKELDFTSATTTEARDAIWQNYFKKNMFMVAAGNFDEPNHVMEFNHICGLFRVTYTNKTTQEQTIDGIRFSGDQNFHNAYELSVSSQGIGNGTGFYEPAELKTTGLKVAAGESTNLYVFFFPIFYGEGNLDISILRGADDTYTVSIPLETIKNANWGDQRLEAGKRYWFKITETADGLIWSKEETVTIQNPQLAIALQGELGAEKVTIDGDGYAVMKQNDINEVQELLFNNHNNDDYTLESLDGIEYFKNLTKLECIKTGLKSADLSDNTLLTSIDVSANSDLTTLNISGLKNLTHLVYSETSVTSLDIDEDAIPNITVLKYGRHSEESPVFVPEVNDFSALTDLACYGQEFTLTNSEIKAQLQQLECYNSGLTALDLEEYPALVSLACYNNNLTELVIPENSRIGYLNCFGNKLTSLDITPLNTTLYDLYCGNQNIEAEWMILTLTESQATRWNEAETGWYDASLGLNENVKLSISGSSAEEGTVVIENSSLSTALYDILGSKVVDLNTNGHAVMKQVDVDAVTELDFGWDEYTITSLNGIEHFKNLKKLNCQNQDKLEECNVSHNVALEFLDLQSSPMLKSLDVSKNVALKHLGITHSQIQSLDLTKNALLEILYAYGNSSLTSLDISKCNNLQTLLMENTGLSSITIPNPQCLLELNYSNTGISLDLSEFTSLNTLYCSGKGDDFAALDATLSATMISKLDRLDCRNCGLDELDLTKYPSLTELICSNNNLKTLAVEKCRDLRYLRCDNNQLTNLNLTGLTNLRELSVSNNKLTSLDVSANTNIRSLYCSNNYLTVLDLTALKSLSWIYCANQKDADGNDIVLYLTLDASHYDKWENWSSDNGESVQLDSGVETGNGNTGGSDFTIEGIY